MKHLYYFIPSNNPSGYTQQGGPASAVIAGQTGKMLQMQLLETNNNINAIKEGAEPPFFLANGILYISTTGGSTFTYGNRAPSYDGYLREVVVSGSRTGSNSNRFQFKSVSNANYQLDFGGRGGSGIIQEGFGIIPNEHWIGPGLILAGQPLNALKPIGALGSSPGSSIASKTLSNALPQTFTKTLGKEVGTKVATTLGTNVIGRALGRLVPYAGWGITIYDAWDNRTVIGEFFEEMRTTNQQNNYRSNGTWNMEWHVR